MIVKWPGVTKPGSVCRENVIGVDFYPTLLEVTKTPAPKDYLLDGLSLVPLLENPQAKLKRKALHWHFPAYLQGYTVRHGNFRTTPAGAVRMGDWKLIEFFEDGTLELYNTGKDISEKELGQGNARQGEGNASGNARLAQTHQGARTDQVEPRLRSEIRQARKGQE